MLDSQAAISNVHVGLQVDCQRISGDSEGMQQEIVS